MESRVASGEDAVPELSQPAEPSEAIGGPRLETPGAVEQFLEPLYTQDRYLVYKAKARSEPVDLRLGRVYECEPVPEAMLATHLQEVAHACGVETLSGEVSAFLSVFLRKPWLPVGAWMAPSWDYTEFRIRPDHLLGRARDCVKHGHGFLVLAAGPWQRRKNYEDVVWFIDLQGRLYAPGVVGRLHCNFQDLTKKALRPLTEFPKDLSKLHPEALADSLSSFFRFWIEKGSLPEDFFVGSHQGMREAAAARAEAAKHAAEVEKQRIVDLFQRFDMNGDGFIDFDELSGILVKIDSRTWNVAKCNQFFSILDTNKDWRIDYKEFVDFCFGSRWKKHRRQFLSATLPN